MARAYLCPHCRARNRFTLDDSTDGVVCCGACHGTFLLPEFAAETEVWERNDGDTSIVNLKKPADNVQRLPTVGSIESAVSRSESPTVAGLDSEEFYVAPSTVADSQLPTVNAMNQSEPANDNPEPATRTTSDQKTTLLVSDTRPELSTMNDESKSPRHIAQKEDPAEQTKAPTVGFHDATESSSELHGLEHETQPDLYASEAHLSDSGQTETHTEIQIEDAILNRPLSATTVRDFAGTNLKPWIAIAVVVATATGIATYMVGTRSATEAEAHLLTLAIDRAAQQTQIAQNMMSAAMNAGRPDLVRKSMIQLNHRHNVGLSIIRPDRTLAFVGNDMNAYAAVLKRVCRNDSKDAGSRTTARWLAGDDEILTGLGNSPCNAVDKLKNIKGPTVSDLNDKKLTEASSLPRRPVHWLNRQRNHTEHVYVTAIANEGTCSECHGTGNAGNANLGWMVVRTNLSDVDTLKASTLQSTFLIAGATLLIVLLLLLGGIRLAFRRKAKI